MRFHRSPKVHNAAEPPHEQYRARGHRLALHPQEKWTLFWLSLHLVFLPWALGTMHLWSQCTSLALAAIGLCVAARPRTYTETNASGAPVEIHVRPLQRLWRFPIFWIGLAILAYIAVQGLNPAWRYKANNAFWWLEPVGHISWLPSGMDVPFAKAGPWRSLIVHASLWLTLCTVWIGIMRRHAYRLLFTLLVANGLLLALLGLAQQLTHATRIFWAVKSSNASFAASFIYRNHAGAYLNLALAAAAGLAWWHFARAQRHFEKSSPASVFTFCAVILGITVLFSLSRGSSITMATLLLLTGMAFLWSLWHQPTDHRSNIAFGGLVMLLVAFIGVGLYSLNLKSVRIRFGNVFSDSDASFGARVEAHEAAAQMLAAQPVLGYGAGCFRFGFPKYLREHPKIYYSRGVANRWFWEHAHNDLLEYPIEFGIAGSALFLAGLGWLGWRLVRWRFWRNPLALPVVLGCLLTLVHAWEEFVFQNPAVLLTWGMLLLATSRWAELDQQPASRSSQA